MPEPDLVERLLAECLDASEEERARALEDRCRAHREVADALRERFQALARFGLVQDPSPDLPAPERLGEFRLLEPLGGGGMGVVHLAEQEPLGRRVALKCIRPEHLFFEGARGRFRREVAAVARLKHSNIVPIYTFGEEAGVPYFAMERIEGRSLAEVLECLQGKPPHERTGADVARALDADPAAFEGTWAQVAVRVVRQVAAALAHAHARGVVHRDVKPSNVMLTPEGRAMLFDFGIAGGFAAVDRMTRSGTMVGSLPYLAPEAAAGKSSDADPRLDVYALGVTLYELLTLRLPFRAETTDALLRRIVEGAPARPGTLHRHLSWDVETVCLTAMEVDPSRRYASAAALGRDLDNLLAFRPIEARRPSFALRARRWVQRRPTLATALTLGFLLVFVAPSVALIRIRAERDAKVREAAVARGVSEFLITALHAADPQGPGGKDLTLREFVVMIRDELPRFDTEPATKAALLFHVADVSHRLGEVEEAIPLLEEAIRLDTRADPPRLAEAAAARVLLAQCLQMTGDVDRALAEAERAVETYEASDEDPVRTATAWNTYGGMLYGAQRRQEAVDAMRRAADLHRQHGPIRALVTDLSNLAMIHRALGDLDTADGALAEALAACDDPEVPPLSRAGVENAAAALAASRGDTAEARRRFEAALAVYESLDLGGHPNAETLRRNIAGLPAEGAGGGE